MMKKKQLKYDDENKLYFNLKLYYKKYEKMQKYYDL